MKTISSKIYIFKLFQNIFGYFSNTFLLIGMAAYIIFWLIENGDAVKIGSQTERMDLIRIGVIFFATIIIVKILNFFNRILAFVYHKIYLEDILNRNNSIVHAFKVVFRLYWSFFGLNLYKYTLEYANFYIDKYQKEQLKDFFKKGGGYIIKYLSNVIEAKALLEEKKPDDHSFNTLLQFLFSKSEVLLKYLYLERYALIKHKNFYFLNPVIIIPLVFLFFSFLNVSLTFPIFMVIFTLGFTSGLIFNNKYDVDVDYYGNLLYLKLLGYSCPKFKQIFNEAHNNYIENINNDLGIQNSKTNLKSEMKGLRNKYFKIIALIFVGFFVGFMALIYLLERKVISQFTMVALFFSIFSFIALFALSKLNKKTYLLEVYNMAALLKKDKMFYAKEKEYIGEISVNKGEKSVENFKK